MNDDENQWLSAISDCSEAVENASIAFPVGPGVNSDDNSIFEFVRGYAYAAVVYSTMKNRNLFYQKGVADSIETILSIRQRVDFGPAATIAFKVNYYKDMIANIISTPVQKQPKSNPPQAK